MPKIEAVKWFLLYMTIFKTNLWGYKKMKKILALLFVFALLLTLGQTVMAETINLKLAENQPADNPVTKADIRFAELVEEKTNGEVVIDVHYGATLGQEAETISMARTGVVAMARVNAVPLAEVVSDVGVFNLPFIFSNYDHLWNVLESDVGQEINSKLEDVGLIGLTWFESGFRSFYTTEPVAELSDLEGLNIRVQEAELPMKMVELLGANPTPMPYGDVYSGLQTGVIDGAENDFVSYYTSSHYEVAPYYAVDNHLHPPAIIIMNKAKFESLSEEHQQAIMEAAEEAKEFEKREMRAFQDESKAKVLEAGVEITEVDTTEFQEAVMPLYEEYPELQNYIERIIELQ